MIKYLMRHLQCPEIAFEPISLSDSNTVIYGSSLSIESMGFILKDFEGIEYDFHLKPVILKDVGVKT